MLKIRLQRTGRINSPSYRIVVTEHTASPKAGKSVEVLGHYNPKTKVRVLNEDRVKYWLSVGAQPSDTMHNMLISAGVIEGKKINVLPKKTVPKKEVEVETAPAAAPTSATVVEETPAEAPATVEATAEEPAVVESVADEVQS
jgi:small subunit ribosomal protein S16